MLADLLNAQYAITEALHGMQEPPFQDTIDSARALGLGAAEDE
jgi:hypothetical protein